MPPAAARTRDPVSTALVTGCSSGIGLATARLLARRGWRVLATARREADLERLAAEGLEALPLELADEASVAACAEAALERLGGEAPDALVNNAACAVPGAVEDLSRAALRHQLEVNLLGWVDLTNRLLPAMIRRGSGRIVQVSSVLGLVAMPWRGAYNASKFALEGLTDTLRMELAGTGVRVILVEPGPVLTRFRANALAQFRRWIDPARSRHRALYERLEARLAAEGAVAPFTASAEDCAARIVRALEARRPRARYYVTPPTHALAFLRRVLPAAALDGILRRL